MYSSDRTPVFYSKNMFGLNFIRKITTSIKVPVRLKNDFTVVVTDDASTIVCHHPVKQFPYEFSQPLPENKVEDNSVLRVQNKDFVHQVFSKPKHGLVQQELMKMTYTTKHRWVPPKKWKRKFAHKKIVDREYL